MATIDKRRFLLLCFGLVLLLLTLTRNAIGADEGYTIRLQGQVSAIRFQYWRMPPTDWSSSSDDLERLNSLTEEELHSLSEFEGFTGPANESGEVYITGIPAGIYYIREFSDRSEQFVPVIVDLTTSTRLVTVRLKTIGPLGSIELTKLGFENQSDTSPEYLSSVSFQLFRKGDSRPLRFDASNHLTTDMSFSPQLKTNSEGRILVSGLTPGSYYFKEIQALPGYVLSSESVEVEVKGSELVQVVAKNYRIPPPNQPGKPRGFLPNTGEKSMAIAGFLLICFGLYCFLVKKKKCNHK
ncbi:TPA: LPXTG cell wall anchor domain-containing protein [Streptococcus suis]|nr:LPXTG cell wall anchor domain-containing protein [Streptococcus suis]